MTIFGARAFGGAVINHLPANAGDPRAVSSIPVLERSLEKGMATHSSILSRKIPWTEELGGLPSMGFHRVGHD